MEDSKTKLLAALWGAIIWIIIGVASGRMEAWDSPLYFIAGFPLLLLGAALAGWFYPLRAWRWGLWIAIGHAAGIFLTGLISGSSFSLLPLTIILIGVLSLPIMLCSLTGGFLRRHIRPVPD